MPRAEAYAVHKLMVAVERVNQAKSIKDIEQAGLLVDALSVRRPKELAGAWQEAWQAGRNWRKKLESGRARLTDEQQATLAAVVKRA